jgi:hypothetical protein
MTFTLFRLCVQGISLHSSSVAILYGLHRKQYVELTWEDTRGILHFELIKTIFKRDAAIRKGSDITWVEILCIEACILSDFATETLRC